MKTSMHVAAVLLLTGSVAYAHTELSASMPADKAAVATAPKEVMLHFTEAVRLTALSVTKQGEKKQDLGPLPSGTMKDFAVAAPALATGHYVVNWRAMSEDAHVMTGEFSFTVGMASSEGHGANHAEHGDRADQAAGHAERGEH
jgi:methionine-rich copper-binding protein CopC